MGLRHDGLRALLDALVGSVERGGGDVAARAHVTRFHYERLVAAVLGFRLIEHLPA